ncbi:class F sortase [Streptomyces mobaraensis]|uniref:class F sortase n=1 Tax=Streptomyces mobaraensis TaxID=35621 RepID=UPI00332994E7
MLRTTRTALSALVSWLGTRPVAAAVLVAAGLFSGCWLIDSGSRAAAPPPQPSRAEAFPAGGAGALAPHRRDPLIRPLPPVTPVRVRIPEIKVDAPLRGLRLLPDGSLASPPQDDKNLAGWYEAGTAPGAIGTAVVAGHVDTPTGPAVFYNLGALKKKDLVEIVRADGRTAVFTIDAIEVYDRGDFPSRKVYGASGRAELRVITCGGGFSEERHAYLGNVVVYAHLAKVVEARGGRGSTGAGTSPSSSPSPPSSAPPSPETPSAPTSSSPPSSSPPREVGPPAKRTGPSRAPAPARSAAPKAGGRGGTGTSPSPAAPAKSRTGSRH